MCIPPRLFVLGECWISVFIVISSDRIFNKTTKTATIYVENRLLIAFTINTSCKMPKWLFRSNTYLKNCDYLIDTNHRCRKIISVKKKTRKMKSLMQKTSPKNGKQNVDKYFVTKLAVDFRFIGIYRSDWIAVERWWSISVNQRCKTACNYCVHNLLCCTYAHQPNTKNASSIFVGFFLSRFAFFFHKSYSEKLRAKIHRNMNKSLNSQQWKVIILIAGMYFHIHSYLTKSGSFVHSFSSTLCVYFRLFFFFFKKLFLLISFGMSLMLMMMMIAVIVLLSLTWKKNQHFLSTFHIVLSARFNPAQVTKKMASMHVRKNHCAI